MEHFSTSLLLVSELLHSTMNICGDETFVCDLFWNAIALQRSLTEPVEFHTERYITHTRRSKGLLEIFPYCAEAVNDRSFVPTRIIIVSTLSIVSSYIYHCKGQNENFQTVPKWKRKLPYISINTYGLFKFLSTQDYSMFWKFSRWWETEKRNFSVHDQILYVLETNM